MDSDRRKAGTYLRDFVMTLLDHAHNEAKTSRAKLEVMHHQWRSKVEEIQADDEYLQSEYNRLHQAPRIEAEAQIEEIVATKKILYHTWKKSKKEGDLRAWLEPAFSGKVDVLFDPVYTYRSIL